MTMNYHCVYTCLLPLTHVERKLFESLLIRLAIKYRFDPNWLMTIMCFETFGQFKTDAYNFAGKVGILPFSERTAKRLGTTQEALAQLNHFEQLMYIGLYFKRYALKGRVRSFRELFMAIHFPEIKNQRPTYKIYKSPSIGYERYKGFDKEGKGYVTNHDIFAEVEKILPERTPNGFPILPRLPVSELAPNFKTKHGAKIWVSSIMLALLMKK